MARYGLAFALLLTGCLQEGDSVDHQPGVPTPASKPSPLVDRILLKPIGAKPAPVPVKNEAFAFTPRLQYYGGRLLEHPEVVQVLWGPNVRAEVKNGLAAWYTAILQSPYYDWLGEYDTIDVQRVLRAGMGVNQESGQKIGRGSFKATVQITPALTGTTLQDADMFTELTKQIDAGVLPPPQEDGKGGYRTIYMIDFPAGITEIAPAGQGTSCQDFCAYHGAGVYKGKNLAYGIHPDFADGICPTGCVPGGSTTLQASEYAHSHELVEATTDPDIGILINSGGQTIDFPCAWFAENNGNEIGDICNQQLGTVAGQTVQTEWSNNQGACIAQVNGLPACIDGKGGACSPCTSAAMCTAPNAQCATDPADVKNGECVACLDDTSCANPTPVCDKSGTDAADTCRGCAASTDCAAPTPVCATAAQGNIAQGSCVACLASTDCTNDAPVCDTNAGTCGGCHSDKECLDPKNPSCDTDTGKCGESSGCSAGTGNRGFGVVLLLALCLILRRRAR